MVEVLRARYTSNKALADRKERPAMQPRASRLALEDPGRDRARARRRGGPRPHRRPRAAARVRAGRLHRHRHRAARRRGERRPSRRRGRAIRIAEQKPSPSRSLKDARGGDGGPRDHRLHRQDRRRAPSRAARRRRRRPRARTPTPSSPASRRGITGAKAGDERDGRRDVPGRLSDGAPRRQGAMFAVKVKEVATRRASRRSTTNGRRSLRPGDAEKLNGVIAEPDPPASTRPRRDQAKRDLLDRLDEGARASTCRRRWWTTSSTQSGSRSPTRRPSAGKTFDD